MIQTAKDDRLPVLSDPDDYALGLSGCKRILTNDIFPTRSTISDDFKLLSLRASEEVFLITLE